MKLMRTHLERLRKIERRKHHPLIHKIHKKYKISKKTLFYVKEYGAHSNVPKTIIRESIFILIFASVLSSLGGLSLEYIKGIFISIMPLIILMPTLNDMIGDYGTIVSSRFSTMLHEGKIKGKWWMNKELKKLFLQLLLISAITTSICTGVALLISNYYGYGFTKGLASKIFLICLSDVLIIVIILFLIAIFSGLHIYRKKEDPNNFLIPLTTSFADFVNMIMLTILVILFF